MTRLPFVLLLLVIASAAVGKRLVLVLDDDDASSPEQEASVADLLEELKQLEEDSVPKKSTAEEEMWDLEQPQQEQGADPGSWGVILEEEVKDEYGLAIAKLVRGISDGEYELVQESIKELHAQADRGHAHAQSTLASLYFHGYAIDRNHLKSFLFHHFASEGGNHQSKMALAYTYFRQKLHEQSVKLYAELAAAAVASFVSGPLIGHVRLNDGNEESKDSLKKFRGEDDDDFQFLEYQAQKGNSNAMHKMGVFYFYGFRGLRRDHDKALSWFTRAVDKGDSASLEFLGEIYARGFGVERNYTRAYDYFKKALKERRYSAGLGYLYSIGQGVDQKNLTKAREYYKKAADNNDANGFYNLGVLYLNGAGVKKDVKMASWCFAVAAYNGLSKAYYQLARMHHKGIGMKKDLATAAGLYKIVAERSPWDSLMRLGLECYLKGDISVSLLLYSRAAELGYEVAQSNAAWILDKYQDDRICMGRSGFCTAEERHHRTHILWRSASEQGNEYAALLIGDAYYYGRGTERDLERAAEAYMHARNAQAMYNMGYMHEHGLGLPRDFHLAKRYYDQALEADALAFLPVYLALGVLWLRQYNEKNVLVEIIDKLPELACKSRNWAQGLFLDDGNATLITLVVCLLTVLYLRSLLQRRRAHFMHQQGE